MMNIKIAKAFRTLSYEASCVLAAIRPIQLAVEEKVRTYAATYNNIEYDEPLDVRYWPHPVERPLIRSPTEISNNVINIFTDGSKIGGKVGAAAVIMKDDIVLHQSKYRLHERCSNNQAEQVAILKALEHIQNLQLTEDAEKIILVNTDSKVTLATLQNRKKHYILIENIRKAMKRLENQQWTVLFNWVKAHVGIEGNEMADRLAKKAATDDIGHLVYDMCYNKTTISEIARQEAEKIIAKWQIKWDATTKGRATKQYFPSVTERLKMNLRLSPKLTAMLNGHGKTKACLNRFKIIQSPECSCKHGDQRTDHPLYDCEILGKERETLIAYTSREEDRTARKRESVDKYLKQFTNVANFIEFGKLQ